MSFPSLDAISRAATVDQLPNRAELTPVSFLERAAGVYAERIAVVDGDREFTYLDFYWRARRLARALRRASLGEGERVAFLAFNSEPLLLAHYGVAMAGGALVAVNTRLGPSEVQYILRHSGAKLLFASRELLSNVPESARPWTIELESDFDSFISQGAQDTTCQLEDERSAISINYTSGTTGSPKGVVYHHRGAYLNALSMAIDHQLTADSTYLWTLPMFHCNGWCYPWATVAAGARNLCLERVDPKLVWELCAAGEVTHLCGAPTVLVMLAESTSAQVLPQPVRIVTAGAPPSPTIIRRMQNYGFVVDHVYGLTETYGPFTVKIEAPSAVRLPDDLRLQHCARQGQPNTTAGQIRVVNGEGKDVPPDGETMGEVLMRGNVVMTEYFADPTATAEAFSGGWFHSGDVAVVHNTGDIELRDRMKDLIISGGENISTVEVEQAICAHEAVAECAIVAMPDDRWGEVPMAFVTLCSGATASEETIIAHCRERLAHFKCPRRVMFTVLPKTATGKVLKSELRLFVQQAAESEPLHPSPEP